MALFDSADRRPVHFMGIGGAGMSGLARIACRRGVTVTGCDADPAGAQDLAALGVPVAAGHAAAHVEGARAVVHTAAVKPDHPELARARYLGILISGCATSKPALRRHLSRGPPEWKAIFPSPA